MRPHALLRLYPAAWRARYQDEVEALLDQHTATFATVLDLLWGALDARLDPAFSTEGMFRPMNRLRTSMIAVFCAYAAFTLGYLGFQRLADPRAPFDAAALAHPELGVALRALNLVWEAGLLALAAGGLPVTLDILARAWRARNWRTLGFFVTPPVLLVICVAYVYLANTVWLRFGPDGYVVVTPGALAVLAGAGVLLLGSGVVSVVVVAWAVARSVITIGALRFARWAAAAMTLAIAAELGALIYWGIRSYAVAHWLYDGAACGAGCPGPASANQISAPSLAAVALWMLATLIAAAAYTIRGFTTPTAGPGAGAAGATQVM
ncbi:MAG TPA: hypothetical protein VF808_19605 [Ktedonobacterales bacterium]